MTPILRHPAEKHQLGIVFVYMLLLASMYFVPACRNVLVFALACVFSFLNAVVIHNHLHQGIFRSKRLNNIFRCILSFGALQPASLGIPAHNLVHHHFDDDGQPDWASPDQVGFRWNLLNLIHFPNVTGPGTFAGARRWLAVGDHREVARQYRLELLVVVGGTAALLACNFWPGLFFVVLPQLIGPRLMLRLNLLQHDGCNVASEWNHSRNFVGRAFNWLGCNIGYHTIHHNRAGLHWTQLPEAHARDVLPRIDRALNEKSVGWYLTRTYLLRWSRPAPVPVQAEMRVQAVERAPVVESRPVLLLSERMRITGEHARQEAAV